MINFVKMKGVHHNQPIINLLPLCLSATHPFFPSHPLAIHTLSLSLSIFPPFSLAFAFLKIFLIPFFVLQFSPFLLLSLSLSLSLSLFLSLSLTFCLFLSLSFFLYLCLPLSLLFILYQHAHLNTYVIYFAIFSSSLTFSFSLSFSLSLYLCLSLSLSSSILSVFSYFSSLSYH